MLDPVYIQVIAVIAIIIAVLALLVFIARRIRRVPPNEALIIVGRGAADREVEVWDRRTGVKTLMPVADALAHFGA
mgnify:CR=1 FL=1